MQFPKSCGEKPERGWKSSFDQFRTFPTPEREKKPLKKTPIRKIGLKKQKRLSEEGSEVDVFRERWNCGDRRCMVCGKTVFGAFIGDELKKPGCFPHTLSKGMYPQFRLLLENIGLVCDFDCHAAYDKLFLDLAVRRAIAEKFIILLQTKNESIRTEGDSPYQGD